MEVIRFDGVINVGIVFNNRWWLRLSFMLKQDLWWVERGEEIVCHRSQCSNVEL